jgi:DNA-binding response OmpR family regulator
MPRTSPVMMVTAYGDDERRRRAGELGAAEFISKLVDFDQLKAQLRQLPPRRPDQPFEDPRR